MTTADETRADPAPRQWRRWFRWIAAWVALNVVAWSLAHLPDSCDGAPGRSLISLAAVLANVCLSVWLLAVLPWRSHRAASGVAATVCIVFLVATISAYISVMTGYCVIED